MTASSMTEILTFSRGYVEKYEIAKRWQEEGLHHATIRAVVGERNPSSG